MIGKKMTDEINKQINAEIYSSYLYLSMSAYFMLRNLAGFANWTKIQAQEELTHAMKFYNYLLERGAKVVLTTIEGPKTEWKDEVEVFSEILNHEKKVTALIHNLVNVATEEKDHASNSMLQWFVNEQVEEEANAEKILQELKMIAGNGFGILMIDRELASRVFVDSTQSAANTN